MPHRRSLATPVHRAVVDADELVVDAVLVALYPKLQRGGFCIVDDYYSFEECRRAVDEYRAAHAIDEPLQRVDAASVYWRVARPLPARRSKSPSRR